MREVCKRRLAAVLLVVISLSAQAQAWQVPQASPGLMPTPAAGRPLFEKFCAACHGADLKGSDKGPHAGAPYLRTLASRRRLLPVGRQERRSRAPLAVRRHGAGAAGEP